MEDDPTPLEFEYVNVDREFSELDEKARQQSDVLSYIGQLSGGKRWSSLTTRKRVVVLAEAGSGKTRELDEESKRPMPNAC